MGNSNGTEYKTMGKTPSALGSPKLTCSPPVSRRAFSPKTKNGRKRQARLEAKIQEQIEEAAEDSGISEATIALIGQVQACPRDRVAEGGRRLFAVDHARDHKGKMLCDTVSDFIELEEDTWRSMNSLVDKAECEAVSASTQNCFFEMFANGWKRPPADACQLESATERSDQVMLIGTPANFPRNDVGIPPLFNELLRGKGSQRMTGQLVDLRKLGAKEGAALPENQLKKEEYYYVLLKRGEYCHVPQIGFEDDQAEDWHNDLLPFPAASNDNEWWLVIEPPKEKDGSVRKPAAQSSNFYGVGEVEYNFYSTASIAAQSQSKELKPIRRAENQKHAVSLATSDVNVRNVNCILRVKGCYLEFRQKVVVRLPEHEFNNAQALLMERLGAEGLDNKRKYGILLEGSTKSFVDRQLGSLTGTLESGSAHMIYVDPFNGSDSYVEVQITADGRHQGKIGLVKLEEKLNGYQKVFFPPSSYSGSRSVRVGGEGRRGRNDHSSNGIELRPLERERPRERYCRVKSEQLEYLNNLTARPGSDQDADVGGHWYAPFKTFERARRAARKREIAAFILLKLDGASLEFRHVKDSHDQIYDSGRLHRQGFLSTKLNMTTDEYEAKHGPSAKCNFDICPIHRKRPIQLISDPSEMQLSWDKAASDVQNDMRFSNPIHRCLLFSSVFAFVFYFIPMVAAMSRFSNLTFEVSSDKLTMRLVDCDFHAKTRRGLQGRPICSVLYDIRHVSVDHGNKLPTSVLSVTNSFGCMSNSVFNGFYKHSCKYACKVTCEFPPDPSWRMGKLRVEGHGPAPVRQVKISNLNVDILQIVGVSDTNVLIEDSIIHKKGLALMHKNTAPWVFRRTDWQAFSIYSGNAGTSGGLSFVVEDPVNSFTLRFRSSSEQLASYCGSNSTLQYFDPWKACSLDGAFGNGQEITEMLDIYDVNRDSRITRVVKDEFEKGLAKINHCCGNDCPFWSGGLGNNPCPDMVLPMYTATMNPDFSECNACERVMASDVPSGVLTDITFKQRLMRNNYTFAIPRCFREVEYQKNGIKPTSKLLTVDTWGGGIRIDDNADRRPKPMPKELSGFLDSPPSCGKNHSAETRTGQVRCSRACGDAYNNTLLVPNSDGTVDMNKNDKGLHMTNADFQILKEEVQIPFGMESSKLDFMVVIDVIDSTGGMPTTRWMYTSRSIYLDLPQHFMFWLSASMLSEVGNMKYYQVNMFNTRCGISYQDSNDACCLHCRREQYIEGVKQQLQLAFKPFFQNTFRGYLVMVDGPTKLDHQSDKRVVFMVVLSMLIAFVFALGAMRFILRAAFHAVKNKRGLFHVKEFPNNALWIIAFDRPFDMVDKLIILPAVQKLTNSLDEFYFECCVDPKNKVVKDKVAAPTIHDHKNTSSKPHEYHVSLSQFKADYEQYCSLQGHTLELNIEERLKAFGVKFKTFDSAQCVGLRWKLQGSCKTQLDTIVWVTQESAKYRDWMEATFIETARRRIVCKKTFRRFVVLRAAAKQVVLLAVRTFPRLEVSVDPTKEDEEFDVSGERVGDQFVRSDVTALAGVSDGDLKRIDTIGLRELIAMQAARAVKGFVQGFFATVGMVNVGAMRDVVKAAAEGAASRYPRVLTAEGRAMYRAQIKEFGKKAADELVEGPTAEMLSNAALKQTEFFHSVAKRVATVSSIYLSDFDKEKLMILLFPHFTPVTVLTGQHVGKTARLVKDNSNLRMQEEEDRRRASQYLEMTPFESRTTYMVKLTFDDSVRSFPGSALAWTAQLMESKIRNELVRRAGKDDYWVSRPTKDLINEALAMSRPSPDAPVCAGVAARFLDDITNGSLPRRAATEAGKNRCRNVKDRCKLRPYPRNTDNAESDEGEAGEEKEDSSLVAHSYQLQPTHTRTFYTIATHMIWKQTERQLGMRDTRQLLEHFISNMCEPGFRNEQIDFETLTFVFEAVCKNLEVFPQSLKKQARFMAGDVVEFRIPSQHTFGQEPKWQAGKIASAKSDGSYDIKYNDDDSASYGVAAHNVRRTWRKGDLVEYFDRRLPNPARPCGDGLNPSGTQAWRLGRIVRLPDVKSDSYKSLYFQVEDQDSCSSSDSGMSSDTHGNGGSLVLDSNAYKCVSEVDLRSVTQKEFQPCDDIRELLEEQCDGWKHITQKRLVNLIYKNSEQIDLVTTRNEVDEWHGIPYFVGSFFGGMGFALIGWGCASLSTDDIGFSMETGITVGMIIGALAGFYGVHSLTNNSYRWMFVSRRAAATLLYLLIFFGPLNGIFLYALAGQEIYAKTELGANTDPYLMHDYEQCFGGAFTIGMAFGCNFFDQVFYQKDTTIVLRVATILVVLWWSITAIRCLLYVVEVESWGFQPQESRWSHLASPRQKFAFVIKRIFAVFYLLELFVFVFMLCVNALWWCLAALIQPDKYLPFGVAVVLLFSAASHFHDSLMKALDLLKRKTQDALRDVMYKAVRRMDEKAKEQNKKTITINWRSPVEKKGALQKREGLKAMFAEFMEEKAAFFDDWIDALHSQGIDSPSDLLALDMNLMMAMEVPAMLKHYLTTNLKIHRKAAKDPAVTKEEINESHVWKHLHKSAANGKELSRDDFHQMFVLLELQTVMPFQVQNEIFDAAQQETEDDRNSVETMNRDEFEIAWQIVINKMKIKMVEETGMTQPKILMAVAGLVVIIAAILAFLLVAIAIYNSNQSYDSIVQSFIMTLVGMRGFMHSQTNSAAAQASANAAVKRNFFG